MEDPPVALAQLNRRVVACRRCRRLVAYREQVAQLKCPAFRDEAYWGRPVPGFGEPQARVLVVGLAPAAHGANRTGRMFTGDGPRGAGGFLMAALHWAGLAQPTSHNGEDGLELHGVYLTAIVRCAPPQNRPTTEEIRNCLPYLVEELHALLDVRTMLALGRVAFDGCLSALRSLGADVSRPRFSHGARFEFGQGFPSLVCSYHPSRQNTQTGRLTPAMLDRAVAQAQTQKPGSG